MNNRRRILVGMMLGVACGASAEAAESTALDDYLDGLSTWTASFTQNTVDANGKSAGRGSGRLVIVQPGKLRWELAPEGAGNAAQVLVADGTNLWSLDRDLEQATVKPLGEELPHSPLMLLAGGNELRKDFDVQAAGRRDGHDWVRVQPRDPASDFREVQFGFKSGKLVRLVIMDKLGQRSTLVFSDVKRNVRVDPALTEFVLPEGVDLIGKPVAP